MATHYAIIADFLNTKNDPVFFDVGSSGIQCEFAVLMPTGIRSQTKRLSAGFASSDDLFTLGGSPVTLPAVVRARTLDAAGNDDNIPSTAVLRQKKLIMAAAGNTPFGSRSIGSGFNFPLGDLGSTSGGGSGAHMLIGNFSGLLTGTYQFDGIVAVNFAVEASSVLDITLSPAASNLNLIINAGEVVVQLAIVGKGQEFAMTIIPPA